MDPFTRPDSADIRDILTDAAVAVLAERGLERFSIAAVARRMDWTPPALYQRFPDPLGARRRVLQLIVLTFCRRWFQWSCGELVRERPVLRLPADDAERRGVRLWAALAELARGEDATGNPHPAQGIVRVRQEELATLRTEASRWVGRPLTADEVVPAAALADGLRADLASATPRLEVPAAQALLAAELARLQTPSGAAVPGLIIEN